MPAAAVIPAPIASTNVAIAKCVVGSLPRTLLSIFSEDCVCFFIMEDTFLTELQCFRHALVVTTLSWNSEIGIVGPLCWFLRPRDAVIDQERMLEIEDDQIPSLSRA